LTFGDEIMTDPTRREFMATAAGAAVLPVLPAAAQAAPRQPPPAGVPDLDPGDQLARIAAHYGRLQDQAGATNAAVEALLEAGDHDGAHALDCGEFSRLEGTLERLERATGDAMADRGVPAVIVGGRLYVNTAHPTPYDIPDHPRYVFSYPLPGTPPGPSDGDPAEWVFRAGQLFSSSEVTADGPLYLEFELVGAEAAAARRWLASNSVSVNDALAADEEGDLG
jgi:hypothetical protein